jgi:hypothetical protein
MSRHPSTEHLAEYAEGVLSRRRIARISSHLDSGCTRCNGQIVQLQQVTSELTTASMTFGPMPDQFSARIDMALASQSSARVTSAPASGEASRRDLPERGQARQRRERRSRRFGVFSSPLAGSLAAVGAAVVIAGGGYEIASNVGSGPSASSASASAPQHSAPVPAGRAAGPAGSAGTVRLGPQVSFRQAGHQNVIRSVQTGTQYGSGNLVAKAAAVLATVRADNMASSENQLSSPFATTGTPTAAPAISATQLRQCVARIAAGKDVLLVDLAQYNGKAAVIVIVGTPPNGPGVVYAAGRTCSAGNSDILASRSFPRP